MEYSDLIIFVMEIIGTVAFASSGAMLAIQKEMDLFGVCVLGATTSVGGGMIRDVLLGKLPPGIFGQPVYLLTALGVSVALFCLIYWKRNLFQGGFAPAYDRVMLLFDAIGLAVFYGGGDQYSLGRRGTMSGSCPPLWGLSQAWAGDCCGM